jgi:Dyp-type peroxidase family
VSSSSAIRGQDPHDPIKPGPIEPLPAPWARDSSFMVFRRLEQRVPEFRAFVAAQAARLRIGSDLLASRMVGRWRTGAPLELAPLEDKVWRGRDARRNNDFSYASDPFQRCCPYAAHIRKANPRDDVPAGEAEILTHRIIRAGIPSGPELAPGETRTAHGRGLMFVCYEASISRQFEFIQSYWADSPDLLATRCDPTTAALSRQASTRSSGSPRAMALALWTSPIRTTRPATGKSPSICRANLWS